MEGKENYNLEDVIEVINTSRDIIAIELAGIRTDINFLLNPDLSEVPEDAIENKELLKILIKILDKAFNTYSLVVNLTDVFLVDSKGINIYFNQLKKLVKELINLVYELDNFKELEGVPEAEDLKSVVAVEFNLNKLILCYDMINKNNWSC